MIQTILNGSDELERFYKDKFYFSYSSINKLLFSPRMFYSHYVLQQREDSTDAHLVAGRVLHCLLLEPDNFDKQFLLLSSKLPSGNNKIIIDLIFKYHLSIGNDSLTLSDYSPEILSHLLTINLHQALKTDQQRLDKILVDENKLYFEFLKESLGKTVVDQETLDGCKSGLEVLKLNSSVRALLQLDKTDEDDHVEVYNELQLQVDIAGLPFGFKGFVDNLVIDHDSKNIFINDLKTLGKSIQDFPDSVEYYRYWIQAVVYMNMVKEKYNLEGYAYHITFIVIDKYNQVYPYQVSSDTLVQWSEKFEEVVTKVKWHYENKQYDLPYELALGNVKL
jgi:hypothetical protein